MKEKIIKIIENKFKSEDRLVKPEEYEKAFEAVRKYEEKMSEKYSVRDFLDTNTLFEIVNTNDYRDKRTYKNLISECR